MQDEEELRPPDVSIQHPTPPDAQTPTFFVAEDDGAARLAGVGVFSPVASLPGSPITSRKDLLEKGGYEEEEGEGRGEGAISSGSDSSVASASGGDASRGVVKDHGHEYGDGDGGRGGSEGEGFAFGGGGEATCGSTSGESSFALLEREESFEDAATHIRRRVPGTTSGDD